MQEKKSLLALLFLFAFSFVKAQNNNDFQYRFAPSVDYKISKKWQVGAGFRYSLEKDLAVFKSSAFSLNTKYDVTKKWSLETGYRFTTSHQDDSHLLFLAAQYSKKIKRFTLSSTTRYQFKTGSFNEDYMQYYKEPTQFFREKIGVEYNVPKSKLALFIAPEIFIKLDNRKLEFSRMRYNFGGDYKLKYGNTIGLSFFYEDKVNPQKTDRFLIVTKYNLNINDLYKKSKKKSKKKKETKE